MGKPEGIIEDYLKNKAKENNSICWKFTSPGQRGVPDRIVVHKGITYFVELKSETGELSEQQKLKIKILKDHGAPVYVLNSKQAVDKFYQEITTKSSKRKT